MGFDKKVIYDNGSDFFKFNGDSVMALTPKAAKEVCIEAIKRGKFVWIVEGGHWLNPGYRPDSATRWDARTELEKDNNIKENNELAIQNITEDTNYGYNAFMITLSR